ncbi:Shedu anti-phage system protein SduA domain-containing protein [Catelliglobosispora koreensis]|uniref:Shedu anti-phage system protein SduA domain-containing protein n=1 Tax=Catelliglobosispora koreensis TaxID=129052 RepID=UPI000382D21D|nr:Shedu anti-phage system protein SduA domain-containing protein [Catelliglobosispora koreensis]
MNQLETYLAHARITLDQAGFLRCCTGRTGAHDATPDDVAAYNLALESADDEKPLQRYFTDHPWMLAGELGAGCRWVIPETRLGAEFRADFLIARLDSRGVRWTLVELESPRARLFTKDRRPRKELAKGLNQILEWRAWLNDNRSYARRGGRTGLGLYDIDGEACSGLVLIGRGNDRTETDRELLQRHEFRNNVQIHSYDWIVREAQQRMTFRKEHPSKICGTCTLGGQLPETSK